MVKVKVKKNRKLKRLQKNEPQLKDYVEYHHLIIHLRLKNPYRGDEEKMRLALNSSFGKYYEFTEAEVTHEIQREPKNITYKKGAIRPPDKN